MKIGMAVKTLITLCIYIKASYFSVVIYQPILMAVKIHIRRFVVSVAWLV